ncbi:MAG TPA: response regulator [Syntrophales bacterium]|nr:response regulator [Syntrophales bacterium]HOX93639.1 response regulator [Syntrophales bacterium]HPI57836.1 response regulator [Syntrophales bacterium]HPN25550.1 response regulator [Syntrophales bacterium]HQM28496.1 response regulator [Syntrophales bacterium]
MTDTKPIVFIIDDDSSIRRSLERLVKSVGLKAKSFDSAAQFLQSGHREETGCLILDVRMPEISGLALQEKLSKAGILLPIIFISGHGTVPMSVRAMKAGAVDFLQKPFDEQELLDAVYRAVDRCTQAKAQREELKEIQVRIRSLTPKEYEVLACVITGMQNKNIADRLSTAEKTIKVHRASVMKKMGAQSVADLVRMAEKAGIQPLQTK